VAHAVMAELRVALEDALDYVEWKNSRPELLPPDRHYFALLPVLRNHLWAPECPIGHA
jgi:hypothetical protein